MNSGITARSMVLLFLAVVVVYLGAFYGIEHLRQRKGAWVLAFSAEANGTPRVEVSQLRLGITNLGLVLHGERMTSGPALVRFDRVQRPIPYGRVIYEDLTFLPGVVTLQLYGHEIELVPRILVADRRQVPWQSGTTVDLWPTNKPLIPLQPPSSRAR